MSAMSDDLDDSAGSPLLSPSLSSSPEAEESEQNQTSGRKRGAMASADEEPAKRHAPNSAGGARDMVFRVLCPINRVGSVIGKRGAKIEQIRKETGAKIRVAESRGDADYRVIIVASSSAADKEWAPAQEALFTLHSRIVEGGPGDEMDTANTAFRLLVPGSQIGCLLGKGGAIISQLRAESGAGIRVVAGPEVPRCALPTDEMVQVAGELSVARKALRDISQRLRAYPPREVPHRHPPRHSADPGSLPPPPPLPAPPSAPASGNRPPLLPSAPAPPPPSRLDSSLAALPLQLPLLSLAALGVAAGGDVVFRVLFPTARIGALIGKAGSIIRQLRADTGTRIQVEPAVAGCDVQVVEIQGPEVEGAPLCGAQEALFQVAALLAGADSGPTRLLVPTSQVGCLLGKGGSIIADLRRQSTAQIRVMPRDALPKCARQLDELVQVSGSADSVHAALLLIAGRIRANPLREPQRDRPPPRQEERRSADRDVGRSRDHERHISGDGARGGRRLDGSPPERYVQREDDERGRAAEYESLRRSRDRDRHEPRERHRERERDRGRDWDRDREREREADWEHERERREGRGRREEEPRGRGWHDDHRGNGHGGSHHHHGAPGDRLGPVASLLPGVMGGPTTSLQISVPTAAVGSIIGKGGINIQQIRQISGAKVKLHDAQSRSSSVRMLEISGTMDQTQIAQGLLQTIMMQEAALHGGSERDR